MKTKRRTYPGSIYADRGKLYVHIFGKRHATGLEDNKSGRLQAEKVLIALYENHWGVARSPIRPPTVSEAFVAFLHHKMNRMPKTKTQYELAKKAILKTDVMDVDEIERDIQNYVRNTKHSNVSINNYLTHLQIFLNFCTEKNWLPNTKFKKNYKVFVAEPKVITWTDSEIEYLIKKLEKSHRNVAIMIKFQLQTGARLIDCLTLEPDDIKENSVLFKNKITKKTEERPLSPEAISVLSQLPKYIDRIFPWKPGSTTRLHKWLDDACYERIDGELREVIKRNGRSFQEFRSTFRMKLLKVGTPQEYVRWLMRHKSLLITDKFYTEYEEKEIQNYLEKIA